MNPNWQTGSETSKNPATSETSWTKTTFRPPMLCPAERPTPRPLQYTGQKHTKDMAEE